MVKKLETFEERFKNIKHGDKQLKQGRLLTLSIDLRQAYDIPKRYDAKFASENKAVVDLYREIRSEILWL